MSRDNRIPRIPKGCDQQGRYPEAFGTSELHEPREPDQLEELGHKVLAVFCWVSPVLMIIAMVKGWLPGG